MTRCAVLIAVLLTPFLSLSLAAEASTAETVKAPLVILSGIPFQFEVKGLNPNTPCTLQIISEGQIVLEKQAQTDDKGNCAFPDLKVQKLGAVEYRLIAGKEVSAKGSLHIIPAWFSLLPPLIAVVLSILSRQVVLALVIGIWLGVSILCWNPLTGFLRFIDHYLINAYADADHVAIICFTLLLGGMVGIISRSGGTSGLVEVFQRLAKSSRSAQFTTWLLGLCIFFDDYANTLFVGTAMRPLTDRFRVSREKLSYLVDTTAAPIANLAFISTWIGFEVSLIGDAFQQLNLNRDPYLTFLASIPYRFYPLMALILPLWLILLKRDFGPMLHAERRAKMTGRVLSENAMPLADFEVAELLPEKNTKARWELSVIPIIALVISILAGLWFSGYLKVREASCMMPSGFELVRAVLAEADSYKSLLWGSALGCLIAGTMAMGLRTLTLQATFNAWVSGMRTMLLALLILGLAWTIGSVCADLQTANYLVHFLGPHLDPHWLPALTTLIAAGISFATGSSWATMSLVMPLVIPLVYFQTSGMEHHEQTFFLITTISSVLAGATFGDHCSPISDTTVLSSIFSGADHIDHVRTQLPYAIIAGIVAWTVGDIATAYGLPPWLAIISGAGLLGLIVWRFGKPI